VDKLRAELQPLASLVREQAVAGQADGSDEVVNLTHDNVLYHA
jgi:hypothetical protein